MDIAPLVPWLSVTALIISVGGTLATWLTGASRHNAVRLGEMADHQQALERRLDAVEAEVRHLPDKESVHRIELTVADMRGDIGRVAEGFATLNRIVARLDDYLLRTDR